MSDSNLHPPTEDDKLLKVWESTLRFLKKIRLWWLRHPLTPFNGVSRIHYYEARERYFSLVDLVRYQAKLCGLNFPDFKNDKKFEYPRDFKEIEEKIIKKIYEIDEEEKKENIKKINISKKNEKEEKVEESKESDAEKIKERCHALLSCYESLIVSWDSLTRRQGDLNRLWRTMTRVRSRIIRIIVTDEMQASQLYFCKEEAFRLGVDNDPSIKSMLQDLAEAVDSKGKTAPSPKYNCVLNALIERFNTIRTDRIHQQFINVRTYLKAFVVLMLISLILIHNYDFIMSPTNNQPVANEVNNKGKTTSKPNIPAIQKKEAKAPVISLPQNEKVTADVAKQAAANAEGQEVSPLSMQGLWDLLSLTFKELKEYLQSNRFAFVFFGGLTGGFFSVATRSRTRDLEPGEDVYYPVYILTKPFIGALGAIILYILIHANLITQNILAAEMVQYLRLPGTTAFGFAFIAGFSERIVFPQFR